MKFNQVPQVEFEKRIEREREKKAKFAYSFWGQKKRESNKLTSGFFRSEIQNCLIADILFGKNDFFVFFLG